MVDFMAGLRSLLGVVWGCFAGILHVTIGLEVKGVIV